MSAPSDTRPVDEHSETNEGLRPSPRGRSPFAFSELGIVIALAAMVIVTGAFHPRFLAFDSLINVGRQAAFFGVMALGMVFLLSMREIDLSVGSIYVLTIIIAADLIQRGLDPWLAAVAGIALGIFLGAINGMLANALQIASIIATLGTLSMYRGLALAITDSRPIGGLPRDHSFFTVVGGSVLGIPMSVWMLFLLTAVLAVVLARTRFGFSVKAVGSNPEAARLAGISIPRTRLAALALTGGLGGLAGMLTLAFFQSGDPTLGQGYELLVIAAAIIGGTSLGGGSGTVIGALLGALTIGVIRSGLIQFGVPPSWSLFATGAVIVAAVTIDGAIRRRRAVHT